MEGLSALSPAAGVDAFRHEAIVHIDRLVANRTWPSLDALTCAARYSLRTVLLSLIEVEGDPDRDLQRCFSPALAPEPSDLPDRIPAWVADRYHEVTGRRPWPALMWGQRRLVTASALERASYVIGNLSPASRRIIFLGDDDQVSPLVAALASRHEVIVCDIDPMVLTEAEATADALSAQLTTCAIDLSSPGAAGELAADMVVADPFPSGDGSFERFFWQAAREALSAGGLLISTSAPSHKPRRYAKAAWDVLTELGFRRLGVVDDHCRYEVFSFELAKLERDFLAQLEQKPTIFHTKDTFVAERLPADLPADPPQFAYADWQAATAEHYLVDFARRAGGGARFDKCRATPLSGEEPSLDQLWRLAHQSWTRLSFRSTEL